MTARVFRELWQDETKTCNGGRRDIEGEKLSFSHYERDDVISSTLEKGG